MPSVMRGQQREALPQTHLERTRGTGNLNPRQIQPIRLRQQLQHPIMNGQELRYHLIFAMPHGRQISFWRADSNLRRRIQEANEPAAEETIPERSGPGETSGMPTLNLPR